MSLKIYVPQDGQTVDVDEEPDLMINIQLTVKNSAATKAQQTSQEAQDDKTDDKDETQV